MHLVSVLLTLALGAATVTAGARVVVDGPAVTVAEHPGVTAAPVRLPASSDRSTTPLTSGQASGPMPMPESHATARGDGAADGSTGSRWRWPLHPQPTVVHPFRAPAQPWGPGHRGVDLLGGVVVRAPRDGVLSFAGVVAGRPVLVVTHSGGLRSSFEPVSAGLPTGTRVRGGDPIGVLVESAHSHCAPAACLHWGVRRDETYLDPLALLSHRVVLLPSP